MEEFKIDPSISYDVVEFPSKGLVYPNKKKSVRVAYLTAADENILSSPNLINTGGIVNELIKRKVLDKDLQSEDILEEDRQAILIFLRNTAFGSEYTMHLTDPKTNEKFDTKIDLSRLKLKDFNLIEDQNGEYSYFLKKSGVNITFKYLTRKQEEEIQKIGESWNGVGVAPIVTKRLEMMIRSLNGNRDPMQIHSFIENKMPIADSHDFKKYTAENKPGVDLTQKVATPSGEEIQVEVGFGVEFFRPFYGL
jgi:hypothetical protein